ncbi:FAD-dependent oxidoreductase [Sphingosinicella sp. LY1275]|uniref:FAD-dependent oxidoreductase n=1 Tax=Sphingosinicella sp. LY1275 TaxID=3095379 RepID=UPI002ADED024|nr:FAD-dependent oxidoreductase [Sphingosinicella sp. LY1275]MEA1015493.1 FAD-dependent oxidoreductase [Sphingosinicella sp. LY1275]
MKGSSGKILLLLAVAAAIAAFFLLDLDRYLTLDMLKARQADLAALLRERPWLAIGGFFLIYVAATALSLPGAAILTLAAGAIFGLWAGTAIVSIASTLGACLAFLSSRYLLRDWVAARFGKRIAAIDRGIRRDGAFYLLSLRLIPVFPFFLVNLAMGLTAMRLAPYALASWIGMLPGTIVYVNAGTQIARIETTGDILSPALIGSFALLGLFPLLAKFVVGRLRRRRIYKGWRRPKRFDRNLIVIGAGAGGLVTSYIAATVRAKVTLIEANRMGGDCLNTGCVPSKALIRSARLAHEIRNADFYGLGAREPADDFPAVMQRIRMIIAAIAPADSIERYTALGVDVRMGYARILDPWTVEIDGAERLTARAIVIATGGAPAVPDIPGLAASGYLTSDTMWEAFAHRETMPERVAILGGGPIGVELAQALARLGARVTLVQKGARILPKEDEEVAAFVAETLADEGVDIRTNFNVSEVRDGALVGSQDGAATVIPFDALIVAVGRKARLAGYGLEDLGIETDRTIVTNDYLETLYPNIFAAGDVAGPYQFTHFAAHQAWYAAVNALFGGVRKFRTDYSVLPWVTYTDPEVAHVGHNEISAREAGVAYEVVRYDLGHLDRALTEGANRGFVKLLVAPGKDRILGATIVAANAGELLAEYVLAMKHRIGLNKILGTIHAYPTMAESAKYAAGEWKKAHKPERLLRWAERYHRWRRG